MYRNFRTKRMQERSNRIICRQLCIIFAYLVAQTVQKYQKNNVQPYNIVKVKGQKINKSGGNSWKIKYNNNNLTLFTIFRY